MLFPCAYKQLFGIDCPICGFQRSLVLLVQGNFRGSFLMYPPLIPALVLIGFFCAHLLNKKWIGRQLLLRFSVLVLIIVSVNYICSLTFGHLY